MTNDDTPETRLVARLRDALPEVSAAVDAWLAQRGIDLDDGPYMWLDGLSNLTMEALKAGEFERASACMKYMSALVEEGDEATIRIVDVGYVEGLLWDMDDRQKRRAWRHIPAPLRKLYADVWGTGFMK